MQDCWWACLKLDYKCVISSLGVHSKSRDRCVHIKKCGMRPLKSMRAHSTKILQSFITNSQMKK